MKILVFLTILTLSLTSVVNAGLDSFVGIPHPDIIALYYFESTQQGSRVTKDYGSRRAHGLLGQGATIVKNGKYGKCLQLRDQASFSAVISRAPTLSASEFAVTAWVKLRQQENDRSLYFVLAGRNKFNEGMGGITVAITPSGNIRSLHRNLLNGGSVDFITEYQYVSDNKWHHIVLSKYLDTYTLFLDNEIVARQVSEEAPKFAGDHAVLYIDNLSAESLTGKVFIDEFGLFETGFSTYEVQALYNNGLAKFIEAMPVLPQDRLTTTWGGIKSRR